MTTDDTIQQAVNALRQGGIIAYPTEGVYGLGCDPANQAAVARLFALKGRPIDKGVILIGSALTQLSKWIKPICQKSQRTLIENPITWLVPAQDNIGHYLTGGRPNIAIRLVQHPQARALCAQSGLAIVSTSANISGQEPARDAATVRDIFGHQIDAIVEGPIGNLNKPTTIKNLLTGEMIRD